MFLPPRVRSTRQKAATLNGPRAAPAFKAATLYDPAASSATLTDPRRIILTLNDPAQLLQKNRDQSVGRHFGLYSLCQMFLCPEPFDS